MTPSRSSKSERLTPNFALLWQSNGPGLHDVVPVCLAGGEQLRGDEGPWEVVGLYHDEDQAFSALRRWHPGPARGDGQLVMVQLSALSYGNFCADGQSVDRRASV